jgi:hypothetical protein
MQRELTEREKWLIERIGKVVYRPDTKCPCEVCKHVYENGLIVADRNHALYLYDMEVMYTIEAKIPMQYFDTRQEAIDFEKEHKQ